MARGFFKATRKLFAQIGLDDPRIADNIAGLTFSNKLTMMQHQHTLGEREHDLHEMFDDEDRYAAFADAPDERECAVDLARVKTGVDLVEHQNLRFHRKTLGKLEPLATGKRERRGRPIGERSHAGKIELFARGLHGIADTCMRPAEECARGYVFQHTHARERLDDLERAGQPAARGLKRTLPGHGGAKEADAPGGSRMTRGDHVDEGRLASPIWADERDNLALPEVHAHAADGPDAAEMLADILKLEDRRAHAVAPGWVERPTVRDKRSP